LTDNTDASFNIAKSENYTEFGATITYTEPTIVKDLDDGVSANLYVGKLESNNQPDIDIAGFRAGGIAEYQIDTWSVYATAGVDLSTGYQNGNELDTKTGGYAGLGVTFSF
jgi:hypothetical protein